MNRSSRRYITRQVETYSADGFDTLEQCVREQLETNEEHKVLIQKGLDAVYERLQGNCSKHFGRFAQRASHRCFSVPYEIVRVGDEVKMLERLPACSREEEEEIDRELERLRRAIAHSRALALRSKAELVSLKKEVGMHGKVTEMLGKIPEVALRDHNKNAYEGAKIVRGVVETAKRLQPLLHQAERIAETGAFLNDERDGEHGRRRDAVQIAQEAMRNCFVKGGSLDALRAINKKLNNAALNNNGGSAGGGGDQMMSTY